MINHDIATRQAMVAAFATEAVPEHVDTQHIMQNIGAIASGPLIEVHRPAEDTVADRRAGLSLGDTKVAASPEDYLQFLRENGGAKYEGISTRANILRSYDKFAPTVRALQERVDAESQQDDGRLGRGSSSAVYPIEVDGTRYAVRVAREKDKGPLSVDGHLGAEVLRSGMDHVEHIVAASYEDGVTIAEAIPGKSMDKLTPDEVRAIPPKPVSDLVDTVITASNRGLIIDPKPNNFMYDPDAGFTLLDHSSSKAKNGPRVDSLGEAVYSVGVALDSIGQFGEDIAPLNTVEDFAREGTIIDANLALMSTYRNLAAEKLTGVEREIALQGIDRKMAEEKERADQYLNPEWAAKTIAADKARRLQIKHMNEHPELYPPESDILD